MLSDNVRLVAFCARCNHRALRVAGGWACLMCAVTVPDETPAPPLPWQAEPHLHHRITSAGVYQQERKEA